MKDKDKASVFDGPTTELVIDGCLSVPAGMTQDEVLDEFIGWVESKGYAFGGTLREFREEDELPFGPVTRDGEVQEAKVVQDEIAYLLGLGVLRDDTLRELSNALNRGCALSYANFLLSVNGLHYDSLAALMVDVEWEQKRRDESKSPIDPEEEKLLSEENKEDKYI